MAAFPSFEFYSKYTFLLSSPSSSSMEQEAKMEKVLKEVGELIQADKRMEVRELEPTILQVLFTSAIMRGFRDHEEEEDAISQEEAGATVSTNKEVNQTSSIHHSFQDTLNGLQFSLLLYRYLKDSRCQVGP